MKIAFFGTPAFAAEFLKGLINEPNFEVVAVVSQPDEPVGRKKILTAPPTKMVATAQGIPVFQPTKLKDESFQAALQATGAEIGVVVAYGRILPEAVLSMFPLGCINVHPSLLPKYRGPSPIIAAIANGDQETAVTIMKLVSEMDAGPILAQSTFELAADETQTSLTGKVVEIGVPLLIETLKGFASGTITATEQDHSKATFCKLLTREDGVIDWSQPAQAIDCKVRAHNPWPGTSTGNLKIFKAIISDRNLPAAERLIENGRLFIGTGTSALEIIELQPAGGKRMLASDFLRGRQNPTF
ncbi:MAG: Methionyl-tRNA formyltransferase [Patescibacteria group bacterium]|jgi:methionyl-tRNA formyltransferase|nr:Methionyl-tRNA formyltransferase [Patescibacteria group bacterium]